MFRQLHCGLGSTSKYQTFLWGCKTNYHNKTQPCGQHVLLLHNWVKSGNLKIILEITSAPVEKDL